MPPIEKVKRTVEIQRPIYERVTAEAEQSGCSITFAIQELLREALDARAAKSEEH